MSRNPTQQWWLRLNRAVRDELRQLPASTRKTFFRQLRLLLEADDPYLLPFVEKLKDKRFEGVQRFRAGNFRVKFIVQAETIMRERHTYKGVLFIVAISDRKEAYRT